MNILRAVLVLVFTVLGVTPLSLVAAPVGVSAGRECVLEDYFPGGLFPHCTPPTQSYDVWRIWFAAIARANAEAYAKEIEDRRQRFGGKPQYVWTPTVDLIASATSRAEEAREREASSLKTERMNREKELSAAQARLEDARALRRLSDCLDSKSVEECSR